MLHSLMRKTANLIEPETCVVINVDNLRVSQGECLQVPLALLLTILTGQERVNYKDHGGKIYLSYDDMS